MCYIFRGSELELNHQNWCIDFNGNLLCPIRGRRYDFHNCTKNHFISSNGEDLCHGYSFNCIANYICKSYNIKKTEYLWILSAILFPTKENIDFICKKLTHNQDLFNKISIPSCFLDDELIESILDGNPDKEKYNEDAYTAADIINEIQKSDQNTFLYSVNALLYVFNNAISNLRMGNSSWNRSLGSAYDPISYDTIDNSGKTYFVITNPFDIYRLSILCSLEELKPSNFWFYTAKTTEGIDILCSSNIKVRFENAKSLTGSGYKVALRDIIKNKYVIIAG